MRPIPRTWRILSQKSGIDAWTAIAIAVQSKHELVRGLEFSIIYPRMGRKFERGEGGGGHKREEQVS